MRKEYRDLVICNNCQWSASLLMDSHIFFKCPKCMGDNIEIIPARITRNIVLVLIRSEELILNLVMIGPSLGN